MSKFKLKVNDMLRTEDYFGALKIVSENFRKSDPFFLAVDAYVEGKTGDTDLAVEKYHLAVRSNVNAPAVIENFLNFLFEQKKWTEAFAILRNWEKKSKKTKSFLTIIIKALFRDKDHELVSIIATERVCDHPLVNTALELIHNNEGSHEYDSNTLIELLGISITANNMLIVSRIIECIEINKDTAEQVFVAAKYLSNKNEISLAIKTLNRVKDLYTASDDFLQVYTSLYFKQGNLNEIAGHLHGALNLKNGPRVSLIHRYLGLAYHYGGSNENARRHTLIASRMQRDSASDLINLATFQHLTNRRAASLCTLSKLQKTRVYVNDISVSKSHDVIKASILRDLCRFSESRALFSKHLNDKKVWEKYLFGLGYDTTISAAEVHNIYSSYGKTLETSNPSKLIKFDNNRVVFISGDVNRSSISNYLLPMCEALIKFSDFNPIIVYTGTQKDAVTQRYLDLGVKVLHAPRATTKSLMTVIENVKPYALVDMCGLARHARPEIFLDTNVERTVSLPVAHAFSSGNPGIRYHFANENLLTKGEIDNFKEKVIKTKTYPAVFRPLREIKVTERVFDCRNIRLGVVTRSIRINDSMLCLWSRVLKEIPCSQLIFASTEISDGLIRSRIRATLSQHGIETDRVKFVNGSFDNVIREIDIVLDQAPHGSGTTVSEALAFGVPVVALQGRLMFGKICSAILEECGLSRLIALDTDEYVKIVKLLVEAIQKNPNFFRDLSRNILRSNHCNLEIFSDTFSRALREIV